MAQFYTLEEAARVLGMNPEDLKLKAQHREVRAFMDGGSWQFRVADVDELARRRGMGSDPDLSLSDLDLDLPVGSASEEFDLSEFQIGTNKADLGAQTGAVAAHHPHDDDDVQFDDLTLPAGPMSNSSSTIIGMGQASKGPSDSDVRLMPDRARNISDSDVRLKTGASDSDVRLVPDRSSDLSDSDVRLLQPEPRSSDSEMTLINDDDEGSLPSLDAFVPRATTGPIGSSAELSTSHKEAESGSDFELMPNDNLAAALQPESGSDFELTALDASDEFEATPLTGPSDSDVTAAQPSASGINLARPSDSGINLQGVGGFNLGDDEDSIELAPLDDDDAVPAKPAAKTVPPVPASAKVAPVDPGATSLGLSEKDIFEDTDFSLEVDQLDNDRDDRTVQLERASDFDLDESDSASEVFALDEDDVDQNAATAMGAAVAALPDEDDDEVGTSSGGGRDSEWDVETDMGATSTAMGATATRLAPVGPQAEWGGIWVGLLGVTSLLVLTASVISIDLVRNLYEFRDAGPASGLIKTLAGFFG